MDPKMNKIYFMRQRLNGSRERLDNNDVTVSKDNLAVKKPGEQSKWNVNVDRFNMQSDNDAVESFYDVNGNLEITKPGVQLKCHVVANSSLDSASITDYFTAVKNISSSATYFKQNDAVIKNPNNDADGGTTTVNNTGLPAAKEVSGTITVGGRTTRLSLKIPVQAKKRKISETSNVVGPVKSSLASPKCRKSVKNKQQQQPFPDKSKRSFDFMKSLKGKSGCSNQSDQLPDSSSSSSSSSSNRLSIDRQRIVEDVQRKIREIKNHLNHEKELATTVAGKEKKRSWIGRLKNTPFPGLIKSKNLLLDSKTERLAAAVVSTTDSAAISSYDDDDDDDDDDTVGARKVVVDRLNGSIGSDVGGDDSGNIEQKFSNCGQVNKTENDKLPNRDAVIRIMPQNDVTELDAAVLTKEEKTAGNINNDAENSPDLIVGSMNIAADNSQIMKELIGGIKLYSNNGSLVGHDEFSLKKQLDLLRGMTSHDQSAYKRRPLLLNETSSAGSTLDTEKTSITDERTNIINSSRILGKTKWQLNSQSSDSLYDYLRTTSKKTIDINKDPLNNDFTKMNSQEILYPALTDCKDDINTIIPFLSVNLTWEGQLSDYFQRLSISTVGQLAKMSLYAANFIPVGDNRILRLKKALKKYDNARNCDYGPKADSDDTVEQPVVVVVGAGNVPSTTARNSFSYISEADGEKTAELPIITKVVNKKRSDDADNRVFANDHSDDDDDDGQDKKYQSKSAKNAMTLHGTSKANVETMIISDDKVEKPLVKTNAIDDDWDVYDSSNDCADSDVIFKTAVKRRKPKDDSYGILLPSEDISTPPLVIGGRIVVTRPSNTLTTTTTTGGDASTTSVEIADNGKPPSSTEVVNESSDVSVVSDDAEINDDDLDDSIVYGSDDCVSPDMIVINTTSMMTKKSSIDDISILAIGGDVGNVVNKPFPVREASIAAIGKLEDGVNGLSSSQSESSCPSSSKSFNNCPADSIVDSLMMNDSTTSDRMTVVNTVIEQGTTMDTNIDSNDNDCNSSDAGGGGGAVGKMTRSICAADGNDISLAAANDESIEMKKQLIEAICKSILSQSMIDDIIGNDEKCCKIFEETASRLMNVTDKFNTDLDTLFSSLYKTKKA